MDISAYTKQKFNQLEEYSVVEYEYNEDAQDILDNLEDN